MSRTQTVCVSSTPGDATAEASRVAENLRGTGKVVTIGEEYTQSLGHKAGMLAVDLTIEDASASGEPAGAPPSAGTTTPPEEQAPSANRLAEQGGAPAPEPLVVMATADGFDREETPLAEQYPSKITPARKKTKATA